MKSVIQTFRRVLSLFVLTSLFSTASAQVTTASMSGKITDDKGAPLPGVTVIATHTPSGTNYGTTTNANGNYNILYMRTGGPYNVRMSFVGFKTVQQGNIYLSLGETKDLSYQLLEENATAEVTIIANANQVIAADRTGNKQNVSTAEIESLPTVARSIQDFTKVSPMVVGNNVGGANGKYNNIQIDGATSNDAFGLGDSGAPGAQAGAQPIGLDAIAEFNVEVAPFDVRQSGFTGGLINAVTRSGNNKFQGSIFGYGRNQDLVGDLTKDAGGNALSAPSTVTDFTDTQYGFRLGGPIKKDKLFFFINGELRDRGDPLDTGLKDYNPSIAPNVFGATKADMDRILAIASAKGITAGSYENFDATTASDYLLARVDYNISNKHRLMLRHNYVDATRALGVSRGTTSFALDSQAYDFLSTQNSTVLQLTSVLGAKIGNEARLVYTTVRDKRNPRIAATPQIEIQNVSASGNTVFLGIERSSQQNALDQDIISFTNNFSYFTGNHNITAGVQIDQSTFSNLFIQDAYGSWRFSNIDNFEKGIFNRYRKSYLLAGVTEDRAEWTLLQPGAYLQDQVKLGRARVTLGFRVDMPTFGDKPLENANFATDFPGRNTSSVPSGQVLFSPRLGFNYDVTGNRSTQLRGGVGVFSGKTPGVWLSNQYSNTGVDFARLDISAPAATGIPTANFDPNFKPTNVAVTATTAIALTDKDFKLPQVIRTNIGLDQRLPLGLIGTVEFLYSKNMNDIAYENLNLDTASASNISTTIKPADGRPYYVANRKTFVRNGANTQPYTSVILLKNTDQGYTQSFIVQLQKPESKGVFGSLAYTNSKTEDVNSGTSSVALSQYEFNMTAGNPNQQVAARSNYDVPHRVIGTLSYKFNWGRNFASTASFLYEGRSGRPYSVGYNGDANRDGQFSNDLAYIPKDGTDIVLLSNNWADLDAFIKSVPEIDAQRGKIFPRNGARQPWRNSLDFRFAQDIPTVKGQRFQLTFDVLNVLSLINEDWGAVKFVSNESYLMLNLDSTPYDATGKPRVRFTKPSSGTPYSSSSLASRWQAQAGLRYTF